MVRNLISLLSSKMSYPMDGAEERNDDGAISEL